MDSSKKSISSSSTHNFGNNYEDVTPSPLPHQHPLEGAGYPINSDGHIVSNTEGLNDVNQTFTEKPFILEIPNGSNVISCVTQFAQRYQLPLTVLCGNGLISEVDFTFAQSPTHPTFVCGCYQMISFSGFYSCLNADSDDIISSFTVSLADAQGTTVGGLVASRMKAASPVTLVVCITHDLS
ncbi:hypothetical protein POM88_002436 [Heracleum sosnowskyi]|uniref:PPC domain-containing protein n=1 Tax=Heracleum sosnowskyi TaxID=360622 RepID=A0AAD8JFP5_9APIA|nr:hypothetical protein POM88_002428 [Heracleum sosnowskyi]KAK1402825.1 hypothetical protein POM88_002430 [Heracleum sosnowskyi]KAK1402829.1 hypothetical protein POM88_002434 [Heracleum sosnowskyi]KAK1402831.1 hypothetical protein POM88_002436 [Heracleum sosnowskyi]